MEIGDWKSTRDLNDLYLQIRKLGLERNIAELDAFGFTLIEDALSPDLTVRLRAAVIDAAEEKWNRKIDIENETEHEGYDLIPYLLFKDPVFEEALLNPKPLTLVTYLMGRHVMLSSLASHFKAPGGAPIVLHSDTGNGVPAAPLAPYSHVCNCNCALTDYTEEGGCLGVVPGSHRYFRQPTPSEMTLGGENGNPNAVPIEVPAGTAIIWHGNTWHGSYARKIPGVRINLSLYFCRQYLQPQENYRDHVPAEVAERHKDDPQFATLMGRDTTYGWTEEGPDLKKMRANPAGRSWHS